MDTFLRYITVKTVNEAIKTIAILITAIATSLAAHYSYLAVKESRAEAEYARKYAFSSEQRHIVGRLKAAAVSLKQADRAYQQYQDRCCSMWSLEWSSDSKENPELTLRYSQNILNAANNFLALLIEASAYNVVEADSHISEVNKWIGVLPDEPKTRSKYYVHELDSLIASLDAKYKNLTNELSVSNTGASTNDSLFSRFF